MWISFLLLAGINRICAHFHPSFPPRFLARKTHINTHTQTRVRTRSSRRRNTPTHAHTQTHKHKLTHTDTDNERPFIYLSVFKWETRKGWDILLKAYFSAFTHTHTHTTTQKVALVLLTNAYHRYVLYADIGLSRIHTTIYI